jgi:AcrR family transcriptional regulator
VTTLNPGARPSEGAEDARVARTRADVSRAALEVLTQEDWDAVTHARIAEKAGYSKTTLYTHWPSKNDLVAMALDAIGDLPHHDRTGDLRTDLIAELVLFRTAVRDMRLDRVLLAMAQSASVERMAQVREDFNRRGQRMVRDMLADAFTGARLEAAVSMISGVVACPTIMFGELPDDDVIAAAVDIVLAARDSSEDDDQ